MRTCPRVHLLLLIYLILQAKYQRPSDSSLVAFLFMIVFGVELAVVRLVYTDLVRILPKFNFGGITDFTLREYTGSCVKEKKIRI